MLWNGSGIQKIREMEGEGNGKRDAMDYKEIYPAVGFYSVLVLGTEPRAFTCWANSLSLSYIPGPRKTSKYVILKTTTQRNSNYR